MTVYELTVKTTGPQFSFRYQATLRSGSGKGAGVVAEDFFMTILGARCWAWRKARKDRRARRVYTFEVKS